MTPRRIVKAGLTALGGLPGLRSLGCHGAVVFCFHGVADKIVDPRVELNHLAVDDFRRQILWLRGEFEIIGVHALVEFLDHGRPLPARVAVLTFDDGYRNNLTVAAPLLMAHRIPFTIFINTRHIDEQRRLPTYVVRTAILYTRATELRLTTPALELPLTTSEQRQQAAARVAGALKRLPRERLEIALQQIEQLLAPGQRAELDARFTADALLTWTEVHWLSGQGVTIGSHGHDHLILNTAQSLPEIESQVKRSRQRLLEEIGSAEFLAYPNGGVDDVAPATLAAVKAAGYRMAFTTVPAEIHSGDPRFWLPRVLAEDTATTRFLARSTRPRRASYREAYRTLTRGMSTAAGELGDRCG